MLVAKHEVQHDGVVYPKGKPLPNGISKKDADRLLRIGACVDGTAALLAASEEAAAIQPIPLPVVEGIPGPKVIMNEPVDLNYDAADAIQGARRR